MGDATSCYTTCFVCLVTIEEGQGRRQRQEELAFALRTSRSSASDGSSKNRRLPFLFLALLGYTTPQRISHQRSFQPHSHQHPILELSQASPHDRSFPSLLILTSILQLCTPIQLVSTTYHRSTTETPSQVLLDLLLPSIVRRSDERSSPTLGRIGCPSSLPLSSRRPRTFARCRRKGRRRRLARRSASTRSGTIASCERQGRSWVDFDLGDGWNSSRWGSLETREGSEGADRVGEEGDGREEEECGTGRRVGVGVGTGSSRKGTEAGTIEGRGGRRSGEGGEGRRSTTWHDCSKAQSVAPRSRASGTITTVGEGGYEGKRRWSWWRVLLGLHRLVVRSEAMAGGGHSVRFSVFAVSVSISLSLRSQFSCSFGTLGRFPVSSCS